VGNNLQEKLGSLLLDGNLGILGNLVVATGSPQKGDILTAQDNNGTVGWGQVTASHGMIVFNYASANPTTNVVSNGSGSYTWTVPSGITSVDVKVWGGGGGGSYGGEIGGAGGYAESVLSVNLGTPYIVQIGAGGITGPSYTNESGQDGGQSSFGSNLVSASGGQGAIVNTYGYYGLGGSGLNGQLKLTGNSGTDFGGFAPMIGTSQNISPTGVYLTTGYSLPISNSIGAGGKGNAGYITGTNAATNFNGGDGMVIITY
jgi:hypothetical protein